MKLKIFLLGIFVCMASTFAQMSYPASYPTNLTVSNKGDIKELLVTYQGNGTVRLDVRFFVDGVSQQYYVLSDNGNIYALSALKALQATLQSAFYESRQVALVYQTGGGNAGYLFGVRLVP